GSAGGPDHCTATNRTRPPRHRVRRYRDRVRPSPTTTYLSVLVAAVLGAALFVPTTPPGANDPVTNPAGRRLSTVRPVESRQPLAVTSEGLAASGAPAWHSAGHTGAGTTVAILDVGFDGLIDVAADELPADMVKMAFDKDGVLDALTDHGTQMAEIVYDVAPDADLVAVTFADNKFAETVAWLELTGVDVVSFSMEWTDGPLDGTHWTAPIIQASIDAGITWVVAAGNSAETHHNGTTMDVD
ncbi:uncharacterized protein METZ01_LOCUS479804, partial [marine metagenome]